MRTSILVFLALFVVGVYAVEYYDRAKCGRTVKYTSFNLTSSNGKTGHPTHLAPWAVQIWVRNEGGKGRNPVCGGTLVSTNLVLTSAHCFRRISTEGKNETMMSEEQILRDTTVVVGAMCAEINFEQKCLYEEQLGKTMKVHKVRMGRVSWNYCSGGDTALLKLEDSINGVEGANYICRGEDLKVHLNSNVTAFGWGPDPLHGAVNEPVSMIHVANFAPMSLEKCNSTWEGTVPSGAFCVAEEKTKKLCSSDFGGGLTVKEKNRHFLVALTTRGSNCSTSDDPKAIIAIDLRQSHDC